MKFISPVVILVWALLGSIAVTNAQSPREQLNLMVEQLRKTPGDDALREKILKLVKTLKPVPATPPEAEKFEGRAEYAFRHAKTEADFAAAAQEYEGALAVAPWIATDYFNLGVIQEKAGNLAGAKKSFEWYLKASPNAADAKDIRKRIAGLEFGIEAAQKTARAEDNKRSAEQAKRDVITQIKNVVANRTYEMRLASYSETSQMAGVSDNELFNGGKYYVFEFDGKENAYYWKFYDDRAELWAYNNSTTPAYVGVSTGPDLKSVRWSYSIDGPAIWGFFDLSRDGRLYAGRQKPVNAPETDPNKRYMIEMYDAK